MISDPARVVAVEAGATAFGCLSRNAAKNPGRFTTVHRALSTVNGEIVEFFSDDTDTASASLVQSMATRGSATETVTTIGLADLLPVHDDPSAVTFLKLDIEGMEEAVVASCPTSSFDDVVVMYEDHGRDRTSATTAMLLERGFSVWLLLAEGSAVAVCDAGQVLPYKVDPRKGYNLVAARPGTRGAERVSSVVAG